MISSKICNAQAAIMLAAANAFLYATSISTSCKSSPKLSYELIESDGEINT